MKEIEYIIDNDLAPYVNSIMVGGNNLSHSDTSIPLYADGYPGIMFQQAENGFFLYPKGKKLSELFLYGQTLQPISLEVKGKHQFIVVQLYPFASKYLLGINPRELNDDCYDLLKMDYLIVEQYRLELINSTTVKEQVQIITGLMRKLVSMHKTSDNDVIEKAISIIIDCNGQIRIKEILDRLFVTERTFERNFLSQIGLTPKQFARIIQFQTSIEKLTKSKYESLLNVGLDSGFSDQSHFIRTFKSYTGQTPSFYLNQL